MSAQRIRELNDQFRNTLQGGKVVVTSGVEALGENILSIVLGDVQMFSAFEPATTPHGEHNFGVFEVDGRKLFWKIDYYDAAMERRSDNPADPSTTTRVLTIMLASEC